MGEYDLFLNDDKKQNESEDSDLDETDENPTVVELAKGYDYLLGMKIWSLTLERVRQLYEELGQKTESINELQITSPSTIWLRDLDVIEEALDERDTELKATSKDKKN